MSSNTLVPIPLPLRGLNTVNPFSPLEAGYARELTNLSIYNGRLFVRPAVRVSAAWYPFISRVEWFDVDGVHAGTSAHAILNDGRIRNLTDGSGASSIGGSVVYNATRVKHLSLDLVFGLREPRSVSNPFTAWTFTTLGITATDIRAGCSHKGRLYVCDDSVVEFSAVAQITGTMEGSIDFAEFLDGQSILRIFSVTVNPSVTTENVFVILGDGGRVLIYQGDWPESPTWSLVGKFDMPAPISNVTFCEVDGDVLVGTKQYCYWLRDLFGGGAQTAYANSPSRPIESLWAGSGWTDGSGTNPTSSMFYDQKLDAIVVWCGGWQFGQTLFQIGDYGAFGHAFVYFRKYGAWAVWLASDFVWPVRSVQSGFDHKHYAAGNALRAMITTLTHDKCEDEGFELVNSVNTTVTYDIETSWKTPYFQPFPGRGCKVTGVRPFYQNSVDGYLHEVQSIFDYSDYNALLGWRSQSTVTAVPPGKYKSCGADESVATWDHYSPKLSLGGDGGSVSLCVAQKRKQGSSDDQSQSIYAVVLSLEPLGENHP